MKLVKKWQKQVFAAVLGAAVVGAPLFTIHAEQATLSPEGERYDVRRGRYQKDGGSNEHVRLGKYADEKHVEARDKERREDLARRQAEERKNLDKRQAEERKDLEKQQSKEREERREERGERKDHRDQHPDKHPDGGKHEGHEYRYNVRRGMYEKKGGSDIHVREGKYARETKNN